MAAGPGRRVPPCPDRAKPVPPTPLACPVPSALARPASPVPWVPLARPPLAHHAGRSLAGTILALAADPRRGCG